MKLSESYYHSLNVLFNGRKGKVREVMKAWVNHVFRMVTETQVPNKLST